jgi:hypothetical protein
MTHVFIHDKLYENLETRTVKELTQIHEEAREHLNRYRNLTRGARKRPGLKVHIDEVEKSLRKKADTVWDILATKLPEPEKAS